MTLASTIWTSYLIATVPPAKERGHALLLPEPWRDLRLCVREVFPGGWVLDHFDSGMRAADLLRARSLNGAIYHALLWLRRATPEQLGVLRGGWRTNQNFVDYRARLDSWRRAA